MHKEMAGLSIFNYNPNTIICRWKNKWATTFLKEGRVLRLPYQTSWTNHPYLVKKIRIDAFFLLHSGSVDRLLLTFFFFVVLDTDEKPSASSEYQMPDSVLRLRTKSTSDSENMHKHSPSCPKASRGHSVIVYMMYLVLSVVLLLLCFGIRRCMNPLSVPL